MCPQRSPWVLVLGMCLLPFPRQRKPRSTAPFVERTFPPPRPLGSICVCMRGSQCTSVQGVDGIWRVLPPWRCTSSLVASRTVPTTVTCGKGYHSKQALLQHLKVHQPPASVEDRSCPDCKQVFNLVKTMREHRATHRGPFPCPMEDCPAIFSLPKRRNRHLREKHGFDSRRN